MPSETIVNLDVPYKSQLDNAENPMGSCNVTSLAMCLSFFGVEAKTPNMQLEDELYRACEERGLKRHSPDDLATLSRLYGIIDRFNPKSSWETVKAWLSSGKPVIVHGYFTDFGHIIVLRGFNAHGWIVNDPYGEIMYDATSKDRYYRTDLTGENLTYSYAMMENLCSPDGDLWVHYLN